MIDDSHIRHAVLAVAFAMAAALWSAPTPAAEEAESTPPPPAFEVPTTSPRAEVHQRIAGTDVEIRYHRPSRRGREIFGGLVPWDRIWRTGADSATRISFSTPVRFGDTPVDAGAYELFTIPGRDEWTAILQEERSRWGAYAYDPANDVARVTVPARALAEPVESLRLELAELRPAAAELRIEWERTGAAVPIAVDVRATVVPALEEALAAEDRPPRFRAAMFYFEHDLDLDRAAELIDRALEDHPKHVGMLYRQALILERLGDHAGARAAAEATLENAADQAPHLRDEYTRLAHGLLERLD